MKKENFEDFEDEFLSHFNTIDINTEGKPLKNITKDKNGKKKIEEKWSCKKKMNQRYFDIASETAGEFSDNKLGTIDGCAQTVRFVNGKVYQTFFCKDRLCPLCSWRTAGRVQGEISEILDMINNDHPEYRYIFLTLTVPDVEGEDLGKTIHEMNTACNRLFHYKDVKKSVKGYVKKVEVTVKRAVVNDDIDEYDKVLLNMPIYSKMRSSEDINRVILTAYHPHIHLLIAVKPSYFKGGNYLSQEKWTALWERAMQKKKKEKYKGVKHFIVNVQAVKNKKGDKGGDGLKEAIKETAKYALKSTDYLRSQDDDHSSDDYYADKVVLKVLHKQLKRVRMLAYGGDFKECYKFLKENVKEEKEKELKEALKEPNRYKKVETMTATWKGSYQKYYVKSIKKKTIEEVINENEEMKKKSKTAWRENVMVVTADSIFDDDFYSKKLED